MANKANNQRPDENNRIHGEIKKTPPSSGARRPWPKLWLSGSNRKRVRSSRPSSSRQKGFGASSASECSSPCSPAQDSLPVRSRSKFIFHCLLFCHFFGTGRSHIPAGWEAPRLGWGGTSPPGMSQREQRSHHSPAAFPVVSLPSAPPFPFSYNPQPPRSGSWGPGSG